MRKVIIILVMLITINIYCVNFTISWDLWRVPGIYSKEIKSEVLFNPNMAYAGLGIGLIDSLNTTADIYYGMKFSFSGMKLGHNTYFDPSYNYYAYDIEDYLGYLNAVLDYHQYFNNDFYFIGGGYCGFLVVATERYENHITDEYYGSEDIQEYFTDYDFGFSIGIGVGDRLRDNRSKFKNNGGSFPDAIELKYNHGIVNVLDSNIASMKNFCYSLSIKYYF